MSHALAPVVGGVPSADIAVPEHERELAFYSRVLTTGRTPLWRADLMNADGTPIIGLGARTAETEGLPLQWMPHVQVADVAASAARALELGGRELMHGRDDEENSQWAVLLDHGGAAFGIIPRMDAEPASPPPTGCIAGLWMTTPDATGAGAFYREVIGWSPHPITPTDEGAHPSDHLMHREDGAPVAEIRQASGSDQSLPAVWLLCLPVGDLEESLRRVRREGGTVIHEARDTDGSCSRAVLRDPVGACLALVR